MVRSGAGQGPDGGVRRTRAARAAARSSPLARAPAAPPASPCPALLSVLLINVKEERDREKEDKQLYIWSAPCVPQPANGPETEPKLGMAQL